MIRIFIEADKMQKWRLSDVALIRIFIEADKM